MKRTYIDSCVLIAAATLDNSDPICQEALKILGSAERYFISSYYVKFEILPHAIRNKRKLEAEFYETFFDSVQEWVILRIKFFLVLVYLLFGVLKYMYLALFT